MTHGTYSPPRNVSLLWSPMADSVPRPAAQQSCPSDSGIARSVATQSTPTMELPQGLPNRCVKPEVMHICVPDVPKRTLEVLANIAMLANQQNKQQQQPKKFKTRSKRKALWELQTPRVATNVVPATVRRVAAAGRRQFFRHQRYLAQPTANCTRHTRDTTTTTNNNNNKTATTGATTSVAPAPKRRKPTVEQYRHPNPARSTFNRASLCHYAPSPSNTLNIFLDLDTPRRVQLLRQEANRAKDLADAVLLSPSGCNIRGVGGQNSSKGTTTASEAKRGILSN